MWAVAKVAMLWAGVVQCLADDPDVDYHVGVGIFDVTGPAAEVVMMGYGTSDHRAAGIHMRLHARAFIFVDPTTDKRTAFVNVDTWSSTEALIQGLDQRLNQEFPGVYSRHNVIVAGTHTHNGPGGTSPYYLYQFSSFGYVDQSTQGIIDGMLEAIKIAHNKVRPAKVLIGSAPVDNTTVPGCPMPNCASRNRSPSAYLHNPEEERAKYDGDVDRNMDLIKIVDAKTEEPMGALNWFAVHPTSMRTSSSSGLVSGDNKGVAEYLFEKAINGPSSKSPAGRGPFVAAFAQAASGDVSPNINGSWCEDTGESCDTANSVCWENGAPHNSKCKAKGPGKDMYQSAKIVGERQFVTAKHIFDTASKSVGTGVDYRVRHVDITSYWFQQPDGRWITTCKAALGTAFAAGTTDGPSDVDDFGQNMTPANGFLKFVAYLISMPPDDLRSCHEPKQILLYTGGLSAPYSYMPSVVSFQLVRIGNLVIAAVPGEFTTMAGRRTRAAIKKVFVEKGVLDDDGVVIINNCASGYAGYVATYEEYQHQRYEAGSTAYGPHTHAAMTEIFVGMAKEMADGTSAYPPGAPPKLPSPGQMWEGQSGVVADDPPIGGQFGDVDEDVAPGAFCPGDVVKASFWGAHPRNNLRLNGTFGSVWRRRESDDGWDMVADDNDWETWFQWERVGISASRVTLTWEIPSDCQPGNYSLYYSGDAKHVSQMITISGSSRIFEVKLRPPEEEAEEGSRRVKKHGFLSPGGGRGDHGSAFVQGPVATGKRVSSDSFEAEEL